MKIYVQPEARVSREARLDLRCRLDDFYRNVPDYSAFHESSNQVPCWEQVARELHRRIQQNGEPHILLRVLEVGAGRSGFGNWLLEQGIRDRFHWTAQDVTDQNLPWLAEHADVLHIGDVSSLDLAQSFDIIFSTYVLEHITDPVSHLNTLHTLLRPGGSLLIFCPRYDVPGYLAPSCRHLGRLTRLRISLTVAWHRIQTLLTRKSAFLIQTDLAAFHGPFFTDADAVHWVSEMDLHFWAKRLDSSLKRLAVGKARFGSKDWVVKNYLTCAVQIQRL